MFQLIKTFIAVYESRNFTQAAEQLYLSQPTISLQVKKLEEQMNATLFIRNGKQEIRPTEAADFFYPRALQMLELWEDSAQRIREKENFREHCFIACSNTCGVYLVPEIVAHLIEQYPRIDFSLEMMNSEEVLHQLEQNKADIGFVEKPVRSEFLNQSIIYKDELVLVGDPESEYWIMREELSGMRLVNEDYLKQQNLNPHLIQVNNGEMALALLHEGVGQSIISKLSLTGQEAWRNVPGENHRFFYLLTPKTAFREIIKQILTSVEAYLAEKKQ
ncbi:hypothetical protein UAS_00367 [Enterococcus asini ATCC 700915]|uniref:HTH lysR-type domain-containing protein n=2 Tax=Enterococcus asini TaxID=57732 RepID=R2Q5R3_9ENTE|nr:LysR family transcriptional regulator [Enterococcus asini]EOH90638.1 hypothetical protein UAS_00367 [Enterococcus asini ATCC 700915]EOT56730.1 hypothetical protein I579_00232 [Enterococcus asini ATCC 700915]MDT2809855.1 LysR family transcriptional regulator [Enterococcus asini]OJG13580.1 hypothetical protein RU94_GL000139 [Enterococcus asini]